jgi:hypothetical protein
MALTQQQLRMMAALLAKKQQPSNALYREPPRGLLNALNKPLPMEGRFGLLPIKESQPGMGPSVFNKRELALPGLLAGAVNAFTAPGRAASGQPGFKPEEEGANLAMNMMGGGLLGSRMAPAPRGSVGMNAYHGSPHKFDAFDLSKVGSGEGHQAYGHGLYFAENPSVAKGYQMSVKDNAGIDALNTRMSAVSKEMDKYAAGEYGKFREPRGYELKKEYDALMEQRSALVRSPGTLYHVDIPDEAVAKMLDWDKPIAQQPEAARKLLAQVQAERSAADAAKGHRTLKLTDIRQDSQGQPLNEMSGGQLYNYLASARYGGSQEKATAALKAAGIPGIRYLDQGSRSKANGTRNFVLFDDKLAKITKKE